MNRRHLIAIAGLAAISGPTLVGVQLYQWWDVPPNSPYHLLHTHEAKMVQHICRAMFPAGEEITVDGGDLYLERFFDQLLLTLGETEQKLIKLFLYVCGREHFSQGMVIRKIIL